MIFRPMVSSDIDRGFIETLSALLSISGTKEELISIFQDRQSIRTYVIEQDNRVVATASIFVERKFNGKNVAHVEDVAVHPDFQSKGIGSKLMKFVTMEASTIGCSKIILDCKSELVGFYISCGYKRHEHQMRLLIPVEITYFNKNC